MEALKTAEAVGSRGDIADAIHSLAENEEGRASLVAAGAYGALEAAQLVVVLHKRSIGHALQSLQPHHSNKKIKLC